MNRTKSFKCETSVFVLLAAVFLAQWPATSQLRQSLRTGNLPVRQECFLQTDGPEPAPPPIPLPEMKPFNF